MLHVISYQLHRMWVMASCSCCQAISSCLMVREYIILHYHFFTVDHRAHRLWVTRTTCCPNLIHILYQQAVSDTAPVLYICPNSTWQEVSNIAHIPNGVSQYVSSNLYRKSVVMHVAFHGNFMTKHFMANRKYVELHTFAQVTVSWSVIKQRVSSYIIFWH